MKKKEKEEEDGDEEKNIDISIFITLANVQRMTSFSADYFPDSIYLICFCASHFIVQSSELRQVV